MANTSNLVMPKLGLTMTEGTITEWRVQPGQSFEAGQIVAVVETEKIANEVEAPTAGTMAEHIVGNGEAVPVGAPMARWLLVGGGPDTSTLSEPPKISPTSASVPSPPPIPQTRAQQRPAKSSGGRIIATPLARRIARENSVDLRSVIGSGPGGRIKAADVSDLHAPHRQGAVTDTKDVDTRFLIANVDAREVLALLDKLGLALENSPPKLLHVTCLAVTRALNRCPDANKTALKNGPYVQGNCTSIGLINMDTGDASASLLRCSPSASLTEIIDNATLLEVQPQAPPNYNAEDGGSTAIADASDRDSPYVNFPVPRGYSATLGLGALQEIFRPDSNGQPMLVQEIGLALTYDHAAISYSAATEFLSVIKGYLENPLRLLAG